AWDDDNEGGHEVIEGVEVGSDGSGLNPYDNEVDLDYDAETGEPNNCNGEDNFGTWGPISHIYSQPSASPCVIVYDVKEDDIGDDGKHSTVAGGPDRNEDNSAEDNQNEDHQGCFPIDFVFSDLPECSDGIDNDDPEDTLADEEDPGCRDENGNYDPDDDDETDAPACSNGLDDDGDGSTDWPDDVGCDGPDDDNEANQCSDGIDNDDPEDTLADENDPGCLDENGNYDPNDNDETDPPACSNGLDDDGDGSTDWPDDVGCDGPDDDNEANQCSDGIDNDDPEDMLADENDPGCYDENGNYDPDDNSEVDNPQCSNGIDDDGDGSTDWPDDVGCDGPDDNSEANECSDGVDNDDPEDMLADENDPGCLDENGNYDPNDNDETDPPQCSDNVDNDNDGLIDEEDPGCINNGVYDPNDDDETDPPMGAATCLGFAGDLFGSVTGTQVNSSAGYLAETNHDEFEDEDQVFNASLELGAGDPPFAQSVTSQVSNSFGSSDECITRATLESASSDLDNLAPLPDIPRPIGPVNFAADVIQAEATTACGADATGEVFIGNGTIHVDGATLPIASQPGPNTKVVEIGPTASGTYVLVVANEQIETANNGLEVNALHIIVETDVAGIAHRVDNIVGHAEVGVSDCN
ncbi:MAG: hypothetical protein KJO35_06640, partial [Gammaproteobacteria bacterium]|nr:hypothetical protein [Gammaproteobacteria bacterium]